MHVMFTHLLYYVQVVSPLRDKLDAVLIFPSMPDVMRLNKVRLCFFMSFVPPSPTQSPTDPVPRVY